MLELKHRLNRFGVYLIYLVRDRLLPRTSISVFFYLLQHLFESLFLSSSQRTFSRHQRCLPLHWKSRLVTTSSYFDPTLQTQERPIGFITIIQS